MKKNLIKRLIPLAFLLGMTGNATGQVLIAGTDFQPVAGKEKEAWIGITEVQTSGILTPTFSLNSAYPKDLDYDYSTGKQDKGAAIASHFQDGEYCAVTGNPIQLDSLHYLDLPKGGYGLVFGPQRLKENKTLLQMSVNGMAPGSDANVVINYRSVVDQDLFTKCGGGSQNAQFKVAVNADQYNQTQGKDVPQIKMGASASTEIATTVDANGNVVVNINGVSSYSGDCQAFEITSIEVYGEIDPVIYCVDGASVCAGEFANLRAKSVYNGATYQWYKNGTKIPGATSANYTFETPADPGEFTFSLDITYGGKTFKSNKLSLKTEKCCEVIVNGQSVPASRKIVYMDDFGEFDLSDKTGHTYKVWDYSDIANPKQITKTTKAAFRYALDEAPLGCTFNGEPGPIVDGEYCVAGVLTGYNPVQGMAGAHLEWANRIGGKTKPLDTPELDHSGELQGCALFINCKPKTGGKNIYEREITNLCQNRQLFFECYFSVFTNSAAGKYNPVDITVRLTEIGNEKNKVEIPGTATIQSEGGTGSWVKLSSQIFLEKKDAVKLEIVNNTDVSENGNDLVLDDIIIRACAAPSLQAFYDLNTFDPDTITCTNADELIEVYAKPSEMLTNYFGGEANTYYIYQYSTTPSDKKSWKNVGPMSHDLKTKVGTKPFAGLEDGDKIYFRAIAGNKATLESTAESDFNADDPCASYTISDSILCVISCPTCTEPLDIEISSTVKPVAGVVSICEGESTTLTTNDLLPAKELWASDSFDGFTVEWYLDDVLQEDLTNIGSNTSSEAKPNLITNPGVTADETHTWKARAFDTKYPQSSKCWKDAEIEVVFLATPVVEDKDYEFCEGAPALTDKLPTTTEGTITYYSDAEAKTETDAPDFSTLVAGDYTYYYTLTSEAGCVSKPATITIKVNPIPTYTAPAVDPFCEGQSTVVLDETATDEVTGDALTIDWAGKETELSKLPGSATAYIYEYVAISEAGCKQEPKTLEINAKPAVKINMFELLTECDMNILKLELSPASATKEWTLDDTPLTDNFVTGWAGAYKVGNLTLKASMEGYCDSTQTIHVETKTSPKVLQTDVVTYIKKTQEEQLINIYDKSGNLTPSISEGNEADKLVLQYTQQPSTTATEAASFVDADFSTKIPVPKATFVDDPNPEIQYYYIRVFNDVTKCASPAVPIEVKFYGAPVPKVENATYCKDAVATPLSSYVTIDQSADPQAVYELRYYKDENKVVSLTGDDVPSTDEAGVVTYYATQYSATGGESDPPVPFRITTIDVKEPVVDPISYNYCKNDVVAALTATTSVDENKKYFSDGLEWSKDNVTYGKSEIIPSTSLVGDASYFVRQYYTIVATGAICVGDPVEITVNVAETTVPTGLLSVSYLYSDLEKYGSFKNILDQDPATVDVEAGYTYLYAKCDALGNVPATASWSEEVPTPAVVTKAELNGGSKNEYYAVKRVSTTGAKCESDPVTIMITISDSPMPVTTPGYFCEGETVPELSRFVTPSTANKPASKYELLWYGTTAPTDMTTGSTTPDAAPSTAIADGKTAKYTYYVAQRDLETNAIGNASQLVITVYPKPLVEITDPIAVCEKTVDLTPTVAQTNYFMGPSDMTTTFFSDPEGTTAIAASVAKSGKYYAQMSYSTMGATLPGSVCKSKIEEINVVVDTLKLTPVVDAETCPNTAAVLHAEIATNVETASFSWKAKTGTDAAIDATKAGSSDFTTTTLNGKAGDKFYYNLEVTAGTCTEIQNDIVVTLGDGPVVGTLKLSEVKNTETATYTSTRDVTDQPYYMCGEGVDAVVDLTKDDDSEFSWTNASGSIVGSGSSVKISSAGVYTIKYSNHCATSMTFEVKDGSIKNNAAVLSSGALKAAEEETLVICEKEQMILSLSYEAGNNASTVVWTKDGAATTLVNGMSTSIPITTPEFSGLYEYTITNYGCSATGSLEAKVKPYIKFAPEATKYIARRDSQLNIPTVISVPAVGTPSTISWTDKLGTEVNTTKDFLYTVDASNKFTITMSDDDYCDATATVEVIKDARLQLETSIDEKMCRGDKGVYLVVDTTGTGDFYFKNNAKIEVIETIGEASHTVSGLHAIDGVLKLEVHPTADATYTVKFTYREGEGVDEQKLSSEESIIVLQPIQIKVPTGLSVCAGDELEISLLSVTPTGSVVVNWVDDASIVSGTTDTETITVTPEYDEETGHNHNSKKVYNLVASMEGCADKTEKVTITVNEPLTGTLKDTTICEGTSVRLDASEFKAATYEWTTPLVGNPVGNSQTTIVTPEATSTYTVAMTRGNCKAEAEVTVNVNSNPKITSVDSLDCRKVLINLDESYGTAPFYYAVDDTSYTTDPEKDDLKYTVHVAKVRDAVGCTNYFPFSVKKPDIEFPIWFSPNGDNNFEYWSPANIAKTYPEAEIKIFDRWGKLLTTFKGSDPGWDGTYNGSDQPTTDYWYEVTIHEIDKVFTGHFTLLRR